MLNSRAAEFLLSRFTTREHATAIVGDLLEISHEPIRFWLAVTHTITKFAARPVGGVFAAVLTARLLRELYVSTGRLAGRPPEIETFFVFAGLALGMIAGCSAARRGPFDGVTKIAAALCAFASAAVLLRLHAPGLLVCGVLFELLLMGLLVSARTRQAAIRILAAVACAAAVSYTSWKLLEPVARPAGPPYHWPFWFIVLQVFAPAVAVGFALCWSRSKPPVELAE